MCFLITCVVWRDTVLVRLRLVNSRNFHRDLESKNRAEVASVCLWVSSPYSLHLKVTVATLSTNTRMDVMKRYISNTTLLNIFRPNKNSLSSR